MERIKQLVFCLHPEGDGFSHTDTVHKRLAFGSNERNRELDN